MQANFCLLDLLFDPEEGGITFLRNVERHQLDCIAYKKIEDIRRRRIIHNLHHDNLELTFASCLTSKTLVSKCRLYLIVLHNCHACVQNAIISCGGNVNCSYLGAEFGINGQFLKYCIRSRSQRHHWSSKWPPFN
jgi:hypothetical protein